MSELIKREDAIKATWQEPSYADPLNVLTEVRDRINALPTASPWHMVKDGLPKPHKDVLVSGMEAINNMRVYKVMVNDNGTWRPTDYAPSIRWDYWMPIEPPKEDADEP